MVFEIIKKGNVVRCNSPKTTRANYALTVRNTKHDAQQPISFENFAKSALFCLSTFLDDWRINCLINTQIGLADTQSVSRILLRARFSIFLLSLMTHKLSNKYSNRVC